MKVRSFARTPKVMKGVLKWLREELPAGSSLGIVMEATGTFGQEVGSWLLKLDPTVRIAIVNPGQTSAFITSLGFRNKTDELDAKGLARYGKERNPVPWIPLTPELATLQDLVRTRADLVKTRTAMTLRLNDHARTSAASNALREVIQALASQIKALDVAMASHLAANKSLAHPVERYISIKGIAIVTATTVLAELGDLTRFSRSRQLTAFAGLSPKRKQSGTSVHGKTHLCKKGSARIRAVLYMAAGCAVRFNPDMKATYQNLLARGKEKRAALGAVMRKLLVLMRAVQKADRNWIPRAA